MDREPWGRDRLVEQQIKSAQQFDDTDKSNEVLVNVLKQACARNRALEKQELWAQKKKEDHGSATAVSLKSNAGDVRITTRLPNGAEVTDNCTNKYEEERMRNSLSKEDVLLGRFCDGQDNAWRPDSFFTDEIGGDDIPPWPVRPTEVFTNPHLCARIMHQKTRLKKQKKADKKAAKEMDPSKQGLDKKQKRKEKKKGKKERKKAKKYKKGNRDKGKTSKKDKKKQKEREKGRKDQKTEKTSKKGRLHGLCSTASAGAGAPMAEGRASPGASMPKATCREPTGLNAQTRAAASAQKLAAVAAQADGPDASEAEAIESSSDSSSSSESDTEVEEGAPDWGD